MLSFADLTEKGHSILIVLRTVLVILLGFIGMLLQLCSCIFFQYTKVFTNRVLGYFFYLEPASPHLFSLLISYYHTP